MSRMPKPNPPTAGRLGRFARWLRREWRRASATWASRAESAAVLRLVAAAGTAGVPAATLLDAWAEDSRGGQGTRLERAARLLRQGATATEAVAAVPGLVQDDHAVALAYGERLGLVGPVVQTALAGDDLLDPTISRTFRAAVGYLIVVAGLFLTVAGFMALRVNPLLERILDDFDVVRPAGIDRWFALMHRVTAFLWVPLAIAAALDLFAVAEAAGQSPSQAAAALAECQRDPRLKAMLARAAESGSFGERLAAAGLVTPGEAADLTAAAAGSAATLHRLAADRRLRARRRFTVASEAIVPAVVMVMGLFVLLQALAVFSFLMEIIHGQS